MWEIEERRVLLAMDSFKTSDSTPVGCPAPHIKPADIPTDQSIIHVGDSQRHSMYSDNNWLVVWSLLLLPLPLLLLLILSAVLLVGSVSISSSRNVLENDTTTPHLLFYIEHFICTCILLKLDEPQQSLAPVPARTLLVMMWLIVAA